MSEKKDRAVFTRSVKNFLVYCALWEANSRQTKIGANLSGDGGQR